MPDTTNLPTFDLTGKVAVVTGGSRGIGRSIVLGYAAAGADVVIADVCLVRGSELVSSSVFGPPTALRLSLGGTSRAHVGDLFHHSVQRANMGLVCSTFADRRDELPALGPT